VNDGEPGLANWKVVLSGQVSMTTYTNASGSYSFGNLGAGTYTVTEILPPGTWVSTTSKSRTFTISCDNQSNNFSAGFGNYCQSPSGGLGVGFWTNKNGQALITAADLCALNALSLRNTNGTDFDPLTGCPNPTDQQLNAGITALGKWLTAATATNMANMLSAQLAALVLSLRHGYVNGDSFDLCHGTTLNQLILDANASLAANGNTTASGAARTMQEAMKKCLDALNNGGLVVPPGPCQIAYVTALVSRPFDNRAFGGPIEQRAPVLPFAAYFRGIGGSVSSV